MDAAVLCGGLAAAAVQVAQTMDETHAARDMAALSRELRATLADIAGLAPKKPEVSAVDDLRARRAARLAAASGSDGSASG
jgi:hypothetical protein